MHLVPPGVTAAVRAQAERALAAFVRQHVDRPQRADPARGAQRPDRDPARGRARGAGGDGRRRPARRRRLVAVRRAARGHRPAGKAHGHRGQDPGAIGRQTFEQLAQRAETLEAADRAAEEPRAIPAKVDRWFAESNFHHAEFADLARLTTSRRSRA